MMRVATFLFLSAIAFSSAFAQSPAPVEAPELVIGDRWVFRYVDLYSNEELNKWELKVSGLHDDSVRFAGMTLANKDAAKVGKTWKYDYKTRRNDGKGFTTFSVNAKVEGWENVEVPAGKFKALKVTHASAYSTETDGQRYNGQLVRTYWYSPEAKREVKYEFIDRGDGGDRSRTELVEYEVK